MKFQLTLVAALVVTALFLVSQPAHAQLSGMPQLGSPVPDSVIAADKHNKECETGPGHKDPCAQIEIDKIRFVVAWDAQSKAVTYIFTNDPHVVTDSQLSVGGTCRVVEVSGAPDPSVSYLKWMIDPKWKGPDSHLTGDGVWYAALHKGLDPQYGDIVGLVQSRYIDLKQ